MEQEKPLVIDTNALFNELNTNRRSKNLAIIEHSMIANKLGILFALKAGCYVNFKNDSVKIKRSQWSILQEIFNQHFNVELFTEVQTLVIPPNQPSQSVTNIRSSRRVVPQFNLFSKVKELLEKKIHTKAKVSIENSFYVIDTGILFKVVNHLRKDHHLGEIEDLLIANKLGILFALKTNFYINFKQKFIELPNDYFKVLQEVIEQHFNVVIDTEMTIAKQVFAKKVSIHSEDLAISPRVKSFFKKRREKITEILEGIL